MGNESAEGAAAAEYLAHEWNPGFLAEARQLVQTSSSSLARRFGGRLAFGTAGLRGPMGAGFAALNDLVILQTSQGVGSYLRECHGDGSVLVGFDGRHNSRRFAHVAAAAFKSCGLTVLLMDQPTPTPFNPFGVVHLGCLAGVQITASHNPKEDNGYKLYGRNGAQIVPPVDSDISASIDANLAPRPAALELLDSKSGLLKDKEAAGVTDPFDEIFQTYFREATAAAVQQTSLADLPFRLVYTPLHGVGWRFMREMLLNRLALLPINVYVVPEQEEIDPDFSTLKFPNPEEPGALDLAIACAEEHQADLIIANDPDADRFAAAERAADGGWRVFKGDEIGVILGVFALQHSLERGVAREDVLLVNSAVSSKMLAAVAKAEGCCYVETMTGFKWMMNEALRQHSEQKKQVAIVYEEALGFALAPTIVPDKDGITAAAAWLQLAQKLRKENSSIADHWEALQRKYGYFVSNNGYFVCHEPEKMAACCDAIRPHGEADGYIRKVVTAAGREFAIERVRDVTRGFDSAAENGVCAFPKTPAAQMITLFFANGAIVTIRTSGTEPKLKWYSELGGADAEKARAELALVIHACEKDIFKPDLYGFRKVQIG